MSQAIDSAINQTYDDLEIIVVNDGSTDYTLDIIKKYSDMIKIINKPNGGTASALNAGIDAMQGEWFKWLSADDVLYPNAIEILLNEARNLGNKANNYIFYTNYDIIDDTGTIIKDFIEPNYNNLSNFERSIILLDHYYGNGSSCLIKKSIFDEIGRFNENIGYAEDYEFWLRACVLNYYNLYLIPQKTLQYRVHKKQLTANKQAEAFKHSRKLRSDILELLSYEYQEVYSDALKRYNKQPLPIFLRRGLRDLMIKIAPKQFSSFMIKKYLDRRR